jgi:orotate phosphoribosyltransferase
MTTALTESISPAEAIAARLIDTGCVSLRREEPYRLPSGWASPGYMNCRRLISFPTLRKDLVDQGIELLRSKSALDGVASIAGGEASGIALAAWMAHALDLPLQYVRKRAVGTSLVEGVLERGARVLLVDDMMAAGASKARFVRTLRDAGASVKDVFVVFDYGTFETRQIFDPMGLRVHALATWRDVLAVARRRGDFAVASLTELEAFLNHPSDWSLAHGGRGSVATPESVIS